MTKFETYTFWADIDTKYCRQLHELVTELRDTMFTNTAVYDVLFERGAEPEHRPESYFDIVDSIWNRSMIKGALAYTRHVIDVATRPHILTYDTPIIDTSGNSMIIDPHKEILAPKQAGIDSGIVDALQESWLKEKGLSNLVRSYESKLSETFDEYNLKMMLSCIYRARGYNIPEQWKEEFKVHKKIVKVTGTFSEDKPFGKTYNALDNAYYNTARHLGIEAGEIYEKLEKDPIGTLFIVPREEIQKIAAHDRTSMLRQEPI